VGLLLHSAQLLVWLWIQPSRWRLYQSETSAATGQAIRDNFALIDLSLNHLRQSNLQRSLLAAYVVIPAAIAALVLSIVFIFGGNFHASISMLLLVYCLSLCIGLIISFAASVLFTVLAGISTATQWHSGNALLFEFTTGISAGALFGCCSAATIIAALNHGAAGNNQSLFRQTGAIVLGLLISIPLVAGITSLIFATVAARQSGTLHGSWIIWTMAAPPVTVAIITVLIKTRSICRALVIGAFALALFCAGFAEFGYEYDRSYGGRTLFFAIITVAVSTYCMLSFFPTVLVRSFVGDVPACITGATGGLTIHAAIQLSFTYYPLWQNLLLSIVLIIIAASFRHVWSVVAYPFQAAWNRLLFAIDTKTEGPSRHLSKHAMLWDEIQLLPFYELDEYLIASSSSDQQQRFITLARKSNQQWAAQAAITELDARRLESLPDIQSLASTHIDNSAGLLSTSAGLILRSFSQISQDITAALAQTSTFNKMLVLRTVIKDLEQLQLELNRNYQDKAATRFVGVAEHWRQLVLSHTTALDELSRNRQEIPNPYTVGMPLTRRQKIFVGRTDIAQILEEILKQADQPPLLLYGARRMGKTSLLYQLHWLLPRQILTLIVDLQGPVGLAKDHSSFIIALARAMCKAAERTQVQFTPLSRESLNDDAFFAFDEWLDQVEQELVNQDRSTLLLALDEFEALDYAMRQKTLSDHAVLAMLRHITQHRPHIRIMLVGSHTLNEFNHWSGYFVNAQVIELSYLSDNEARQLIEFPVADYPLRFDNGAIDRILRLTRGHPYLVQLTCTEVVALKNSHPISIRNRARIADIEACIPAILKRGQQFFTDIEMNQMDEHGRKLLKWLAGCTSASASTAAVQSAMPELPSDDTLQALVQRNIIEIENDQCRFQVEAIAYWFNRQHTKQRNNIC
jgi:hypothetical protein